MMVFTMAAICVRTVASEAAPDRAALLQEMAHLMAHLAMPPTNKRSQDHVAQQRRRLGATTYEGRGRDGRAVAQTPRKESRRGIDTTTKLRT